MPLGVVDAVRDGVAAELLDTVAALEPVAELEPIAETEVALEPVTELDPIAETETAAVAVPLPVAVLVIDAAPLPETPGVGDDVAAGLRVRELELATDAGTVTGVANWVTSNVENCQQRA